MERRKKAIITVRDGQMSEEVKRKLEIRLNMDDKHKKATITARKV